MCLNSPHYVCSSGSMCVCAVCAHTVCACVHNAMCVCAVHVCMHREEPWGCPCMPMFLFSFASRKWRFLPLLPLSFPVLFFFKMCYTLPNLQRTSRPWRPFISHQGVMVSQVQKQQTGSCEDRMVVMTHPLFTVPLGPPYQTGESCL